MNSTICLCMIVKNESKVIKECLENLYKHINYWVICDTGSTDGTQEIIKNFFNDKDIKGELYEDEWKNFGYNRTLAFEKAKGKADYILVMDADDKFVGNIKIDKNIDKYYLKIKTSTLEFTRQLLFNDRFDWISVGVLHEYSTLKDKSLKNKIKSDVQKNCYVQYNAILGGNRNIDKKLKYKNDINILLNGIKDEPNNERYHFYLAESYKNFGDYENACIWYKKRVDLGGWDQEVYYSLYQYSLCMFKVNSNANLLIDNLLLSYRYKPNRLESIYAIVKYYRDINPKLGYAYGIMAYDEKKLKPKHSELFIEYSIYKYKFIDELAVCCYYSGDYKLSIDLNIKLLNLIEKEKINLDVNRIKTNLKLCALNYKNDITKFISSDLKEIDNILNEKSKGNVENKLNDLVN